MLMRGILTGPGSARSHHLEQVGALLARRLDQVWAGDSGLDRRALDEVCIRHPLEIGGSHLQESLLELLALRPGEPGQLVDCFTAPFDVRRLEWIHVTAGA